jgi:CBS-domain-containing membrane protein
MITVDEIMSSELRTLSESDSLADAHKIMTESHIHHIPIVDGDSHLVGLISHRDVLAAGSKLDDETAARHAGSIAIKEFMTRDVATVSPRANLRRAAIYLQRHSYGCLPVVEDDKLVGIITDTDFVGVAINLLEQMEATEPPEDMPDL